MALRTITAYAGILDTPYDPEYGLDLVAQAERLTLDDEVERLNALERRNIQTDTPTTGPKDDNNAQDPIHHPGW